MGQKGLSILKAFGGGGVLHHNGNQLHAVPFRGAGETIEGAGGESGFQTCRAVVKANQPVGVHKLGCPAAQGVHPNGGVLPDIGMVQNQFPAHQGNVVGGGQVSRSR